MKINKNNHVFLLNESKFSNTNDYIKKIMMSFVCENNNECLECNNCKKIISNTYYDIFDINSNETNIKDKILEMKNAFLNQSLESIGYKFYIIRNIEKLSKINSNQILKFIEEPQKKTVGILITSNINNVIDTIKSRCEEIRLESNYDYAKKFIKENFDGNETFYIESFNSIDELEKFKENKNKDLILEIYSLLIKDFDFDNNYLEFLEKFKKLSYYEISLIIKSIISNYDNKKHYLFLELISNLKYNLNKTLVFNQITNIIKNR